MTLFILLVASDGAAARGPWPPLRPVCPVAYVEPGPSKASCISKTLVDEGDDGSVDRVVTEVYNQSGHITRVSTDLGYDGVEDEFEVRSYDTSGRLLSVEYDLDVDGIFDLVVINEYDPNGDLIHSVTTYDGTVTFEVDFTPGTCGPAASEVYGVGGALLETVAYSWTSTSVVLDITEAGGTSVDTRRTFLYDAATGRPEYSERNELASRSVEEWSDYQYDSGSGLLTAVTGEGAQGPRETLYSYDANLRLAEQLDDEAGWLVRSTLQWDCP